MLDFHPVANIFPLMTGAEYDALVSDIAEHGQREAIWLHSDGRIIDGRNRYRACCDLGLVPERKTWDGKGSLVAFVLSLNLHRRHLTSSQRAVVALDVLPWLEAEAKERQKGGQGGLLLSQKIDEANGKAAEQAAVMMGTNRQYVSDAKRIAQDAPDLLEDIRAGEISIPAAKQEIQERKNGAHVGNNSGNNEWYTPAEYIEAARDVMGRIDLDPASSEVANSVVGAAKFYTADDNGLLYDWRGKVFMNPPYAQPAIADFCAKMREEFIAERVTEAIILVNNATETAWFQSLISTATAVCFPLARIRFWSPDRTSATPLQGQAVVYLGANFDAFIARFMAFGWCAEVA